MPEELPPNEDDVSESAVPRRRRPSRKALTLALIPIVVILVAGNIALFLFRPLLIKDHPLLLMVVNPSTTFMVLVQARLDTFSYYSSVIIRRLIADPSYFLLGYWYGHTAIAYIKRYSRDIGQLAEKLEEWFPRFGWLLVLLYPQTIVMVMAGASSMPFWLFMLLDVVGVVVVAVGVRELGWVVQDQANWLTEFNNKWWIPLTIFFAAMVAFQFWQAKREGKGTGIQSIGSIRRELEGDEPDPQDKSKPNKPMGNWDDDEK